MIAQNRHASYWLVTQREHAAQCEAMARACLWHEADEDLLIACRHHDDGWREADAAPRWSSDGLVTFENWPGAERPAIWQACIDRTAAISPYAAVIVSLHFTAFVDPDSAFAHQQARSRERWLRSSDRTLSEAAEDYALLRALDWLSLLFCAARPDAHRPPAWLTLRIPYGDQKWSGRWVSDAELEVRTDTGEPVFRPTTLLTYTRRLGAQALATPATLAAAWRCAPVHPLSLAIR